MKTENIVIGILIFLIIGLGIYGLVRTFLKPKFQPTSNPSQGGNGSSGDGNNGGNSQGGGGSGAPNTGVGIPHADIQKLVDSFHYQFEEVNPLFAFRCEIVIQVHTLSTSDLKRFQETYIALYGTDPAQVLANANFACMFSDDDAKLLQRFESL